MANSGKSITRAAWRIANRALVDLGHTNDCIILAGSGRSGTTWMEELLNTGNDHRLMFEPFHSRIIPELSRWRYRQYMRPDGDYPAMRAAAERILGGRIRHPWIDQFNRKLVARRRIVKDIRIHLALGWMRRQFPAIPQIVLLRQPCAVALSKLELGWGTLLQDFFEQEDLVADHLAPFARFREAADPFEAHVVGWCIENSVALRQAAAGEVLVVFYEHLQRDPIAEMQRAFDFLGQTMPFGVEDQARRPSQMSRTIPATTGPSATAARPAVQHRVDQARRERAAEIVAAFGLNCLYAPDGEPRVTGDLAIPTFASATRAP